MLRQPDVSNGACNPALGLQHLRMLMGSRPQRQVARGCVHASMTPTQRLLSPQRRRCVGRRCVHICMWSNGCMPGRMHACVQDNRTATAHVFKAGGQQEPLRTCRARPYPANRPWWSRDFCPAFALAYIDCPGQRDLWARPNVLPTDQALWWKQRCRCVALQLHSGCSRLHSLIPPTWHCNFPYMQRCCLRD